MLAYNLKVALRDYSDDREFNIALRNRKNFKSYFYSQFKTNCT